MSVFRAPQKASRRRPVQLRKLVRVRAVVQARAVLTFFQFLRAEKHAGCASVDRQRKIRWQKSATVQVVRLTATALIVSRAGVSTGYR